MQFRFPPNYVALCCVAAGAAAGFPGRRFVLRRALGLDVLRQESPVRSGPSFDQRLRIVYKRVRQGIAAYVTDRQGLALAFQHKIHSAGASPRILPACTVPPMRMRSVRAEPFGGFQFGQRVVIRLALAVAEPREKTQSKAVIPRADAGPLLMPATADLSS